MPPSARAVAMNSHKAAIFICGPTAVGKTGVAIALAERLKTEVLSFDSRQLYREMQIGTAAPSATERTRVKHHFIGSHPLSDELSAGAFGNEALALMDELFKKHNELILVGGSGLYMKAITEGFDEMPDIPDHIREELNQSLADDGLPALLDELAAADPQYHGQVDRRNPQRVIRALEVIRATGKRYSQFRTGKKAERPFRIIKIGLDLPRPELYARINRRVDQMIAVGLEQEVLSLKSHWEKKALKTVGYDELVRHYVGEYDRETAIAEIKKNSRRYAKRQLTWFRRDSEIMWFHPSALEDMMSYLDRKLQKTTS